MEIVSFEIAKKLKEKGFPQDNNIVLDGILPSIIRTLV